MTETIEALKRDAAVLGEALARAGRELQAAIADAQHRAARELAACQGAVDRAYAELRTVQKAIADLERTWSVGSGYLAPLLGQTSGDFGALSPFEDGVERISAPRELSPAESAAAVERAFEARLKASQDEARRKAAEDRRGAHRRVQADERKARVAAFLAEKPRRVEEIAAFLDIKVPAAYQWLRTWSGFPCFRIAKNYGPMFWRTDQTPAAEIEKLRAEGVQALRSRSSWNPDPRAKTAPVDPSTLSPAAPKRVAREKEARPVGDKGTGGSWWTKPRTREEFSEVAKKEAETRLIGSTAARKAPTRILN